MWNITKYSFYDLIRSRWSLIYLGFYLVFTLGLLLLSRDLAQVVISLLQVILILCPLIATIFGVMYYYNSRDFVELLLAQPLPRRSIFWGQYLGLALSLSASLLLGVGLPFLAFGVIGSGHGLSVLTLLVSGVVLSFVFSGLAFLIALRNEQRVRGFGLAIVLWLFFAVAYDGLLLLGLMYFREYPLETFALGASLFNPIDMARTVMLLQLDISALMGYTGAVFQRFLGSAWGMGLAAGMLLVWLAWPFWRIRRVAERKDF
ncbi:MAG: ABC transporter permease [Lewinella sp.]|nr:ABC transporter permease [Lewinella sp.]